MTETARPARANRDGHLCPPWCETDHEKYDFHGGTAAGVEVPGRMRGMPDEIRARPVRLGEPDYPPQVAVAGTRHGLGGTGDPSVWLSARDALGIAALVDMLAGATPARHRALAAAIRRAAAQVTEAGDG
jgi:hypothetical protein